MAKEVYRIEIPIETTDKYSDGLKKAEKDVKGFEDTTKKAGKSAKYFGESSEKASKGVDKIGGSVRKSEGDVTKFQSSVQKTRDRLKQLTSSSWRITVRAVDQASRVISGISSFIQRFANRSYRFTVRAVDMATNVVRGIGRAITSIPAMITITLSVIGIGKLKDATVGAAMSFEEYGVSMEHWLDGNTKKAQELVQWMGKFADSTPFSSSDLFPALATGVGISDGGVPEAQRMLKIAADMAALTPGRTVEDAMNALGAAKMGSFMSMRGYAMRVTKKSYEAMGGWSGFLNEVEGNFKDGALKLSKTSSGILATLRGYRGSFFRSIGEGVLEPMKPRLDGINKWLENNQEKWGSWKKTVKDAGGQASEWVFSKLENGFNHIKTNYLENDEFKNLSFGGKVKFAIDDVGGAISNWWGSKGKPVLEGWWSSSGKPWAEETGLALGEAIFNGMVTGIKGGLSAIGGMWKDVGVGIKENGVNKDTAGAVGGAGIATLGAGALGAMLLSPLLKVAGGLVKGGKKVGGGLLGAGRWATGRGGRNNPPVIAPDSKPSSAGKPDNTSKPSAQPRSAPVILDQHGKPLPPSNSTPRPIPTQAPRPTLKPSMFPTLFNPKEWKLPKVPKGVSGVLKKAPVLGTVFGAAAIAGSTKEELPGTIGAVGGGLAGAKVGALGGAALGSIVPGVGTAIGGVVGGIVGGIGGAVGGGKIGENWDSIKEGASDSVDWVKKKWGKTTSWFENSVWIPISDGAINATNFTVGAWSFAKDGFVSSWKPISNWFENSVWNPISAGAEAGSKILSGKFETAKNVATVAWETTSGWFEATVWTPLSLGAEAIGSVIGEKFNTAMSVATAGWGVADSWFQETVWTPISTASGVVGSHIGEQFQTGYNLMTSAWSAAGGWFEGNVWAPLKAGATAAASVFAEKLALIQAGAAAVGGVAAKKTDTLKAGISAGYRVLTRRGSEATGLKPKKEYANGGYINSPHLGLVGEAGPEMIIPLSSGRRSRALDLYNQTGSMLGIKPYAQGGLVPTGPIVPMSSGTVSAEGGRFSGSVSVSAPVSVTVDGSGGIDVNGIVEAVINKFGSEVIPQLREALSNMT